MTHIILFAVSLFLVIAFIVFKTWEDRRKMRIFSDFRDSLDRRVMKLVAFLFTYVRELPRIISPDIFVKRLMQKSMYIISSIARIVEKKAHALAMKMSYDIDTMSQKEPSEFIQTVTNHKEELDTNAVKEKSLHLHN